MSKVNDQNKNSSLKNNSNLLDSDNITTSILAISFPMMITGFSDALYNMIDSIFVGQFIGEKALAALAINNTIQITLLALASLYAVGISSIISRALGAKNYKKVNETIVNGVFLAFISVTLLSLIILVHLDSILIFMGSSEDVLQYSREYSQIILWFGFLIPVNNVLGSALRAKGEVKVIMSLALLGAVLNIVLDALFIISFEWGVSGAAWATILSQTVILLLLVTKVSEKYHLHFEFHYLKRISKAMVFEIYSIGIANFLRVFTFALMGLSANKILSNYGAAAVASFGVINRILHLAYQPIFGSNLGTQALIGYSYGANKFAKVNKIIITSIILATIMGIIPSILLVWAPVSLFILFTSSVDIIAFTQEASRTIGATFFLYGIQIFSTGALLAMGHPKEALFLSVIRPVLMVLFINVLPHFFGIQGVWYTFPVTDTVSTMITLVIIIRELKMLKKREDNLKKLAIY